jgi:choline dehydrogenase-like flavoprotein
MIIDFNENKLSGVINCDICIIGAGAAGITLAKELNNTNKSILLIESGDFEFNTETQNLYDGEEYITEGMTRRETNVHGLMSFRLRYFGGTTMHWTGGCSPLDKIDFQKRDWVLNSGWPIGLSDLDEYYRRAQDILDLSSSEYSDKLWHDLGINPFEFDTNKITTSFRQRSGYLKWNRARDWVDENGSPNGSVKFGKKFRKTLSNSKNIKVITNANSISLNENRYRNHIESLDISSITENSKATIKAKSYVLCAGGFENPRLLLNSGDKEKGGLANQNGIVGRYYLGHPHAQFCTLFTSDSHIAHKFSYDFSMDKVINRNLREPFISFTDSIKADNGMLNCGIWVIPELVESSGISSALSIYQDMKIRNQFPSNLAKNMTNILRNLDTVILQTYRYVNNKPIQYPVKNNIRFFCITEQEPIYNSRVHLSKNKDRLGQNRIIVDWVLSGKEKYTIRSAAKMLGVEFGRLGLGRVKLDDWLFEDDNTLGPMTDAAHPSGTTRMSKTPKDGVVDINCRAHFVDNLFISGSSVFPTNGFHSPTPTIVALSIRLADYLKNL